MNTHTHHDHSHITHSAKCDDCQYIAQTHAHDEEGAVASLSQDLASHNKKVHGKETDVEAIKEAVRAKMQSPENSM